MFRRYFCLSLVSRTIYGREARDIANAKPNSANPASGARSQSQGEAVGSGAGGDALSSLFLSHGEVVLPMDSPLPRVSSPAGALRSPRRLATSPNVGRSRSGDVSVSPGQRGASRGQHPEPS